MTYIREDVKSGLTRVADFGYAIRFLKLLVTPFNKTKAFELGIIDEKGKVLKKGKDRTTPEEKAAFTIFHRLVFNLKKLIPLGKVGSFAAALFLIKEHTGMTDDDIEHVLDQLDIEIDKDTIQEKTIYTTDFEELKPGTYILNKEICHEVTGDSIFLKGTKVRVEDFTNPVDKVLNINIFEAKHITTGQKIYISEYDIER